MTQFENQIYTTILFLSCLAFIWVVCPTVFYWWSKFSPNLSTEGSWFVWRNREGKLSGARPIPPCPGSPMTDKEWHKQNPYPEKYLIPIDCTGEK